MLTAHQCLKMMIINTVLDRSIPVLDTIVSEVQTPIGYQTLKMIRMVLTQLIMDKYIFHDYMNV